MAGRVEIVMEHVAWFHDWGMQVPSKLVLIP
jgi:hypothetical protein